VSVPTRHSFKVRRYPYGRGYEAGPVYDCGRSQCDVYLQAHKDREAARASWAAFIPPFRPLITDFNANAAAALVVEGKPPAHPSPRAPEDNRFLIPTGFSPLH
jgi:hypothetical protein